jgi:hypothetical protein
MLMTKERKKEREKKGQEFHLKKKKTRNLFARLVELSKSKPRMLNKESNREKI